MSFQAILRELPSLSHEEQQQLKNALSALLSLTPSDTQGNDESWALSCICESLRIMQVEYVSIERLRKYQTIGTFREKLPELMSFFARSNLSRSQRHALMMLGLELLHNNLRAMRVPIGGSMTLNHIHRIPALLDQQFPGYARMGYLKLPVRGANTDARSKRSNVRVERSA